MVSAAVLKPGQTFRSQRNGVRYDPGTGARETFLYPEGSPFPKMDVFELPNRDALWSASEGYNGTVIGIAADGSRDTAREGNPYDPIDWFAQKVPGGPYYRSDKNGEVNFALRNLKPVLGTVALGNVGPDVDREGTVAPAGQVVGIYRVMGDASYRPDMLRPLQFAHGPAMWISNGIGPGSPAVGTIVIPDGVEGPSSIVASEGPSGFPSLTGCRLWRNDELIVDEHVAGGVESLSLWAGKRSPYPGSIPVYGTLRLELAAYKWAEVIITSQFPPNS